MKSPYDEDRDRFLVEKMDGEYIDRDGKEIVDIIETLWEQDFSTWEGFGHLLEWCIDQVWFEKFVKKHGIIVSMGSDGRESFLLPISLISPDDFAQKVKEFLEDIDEEIENTESKEDDDNGDKNEWDTQKG